MEASEAAAARDRARAAADESGAQLERERALTAAAREEARDLREEVHTLRDERQHAEANTATVSASHRGIVRPPSPPPPHARPAAPTTPFAARDAPPPTTPWLPASQRRSPILRRDTGGAERLQRSAAKLEAELHDLTGLLGEEFAAEDDQHGKDGAAAASAQQSAKQLGKQYRALKTIVTNTLPALDKDDPQPDEMHEEAAKAVRGKLFTLAQSVRLLIAESSDAPAATTPVAVGGFGGAALARRE